MMEEMNAHVCNKKVSLKIIHSKAVIDIYSNNFITQNLCSSSGDSVTDNRHFCGVTDELYIFSFTISLRHDVCSEDFLHRF